MSADGSHPLIEQTVQLCAALGVTEFVVAPGSRSAPITIALARHPAVHCRIVYDERSAGYVGLGMAQQLGCAVGLVCTSGTATLNFAPAVVEAFYQQIPLLVLTADRPPEWIDQQDNQAIHQNGLYAPHVRASYTLPLDDGHSDTRWFAARMTAEAIQQSMGVTPGPVHINIPLREPLYPPPERPPDFTATRYPASAPAMPQLTETTWQRLLTDWASARRKLIVGGQHRPDPALAAALRALCADPSVVVIGDITSNLFPSVSDLSQWDVALGTRDPATLAALQPDLVVAFGGQVTSRSLKAFLRGAPPTHLWHVTPTLPAPDAFQALTLALPLRATEFFAELVGRTSAAPPISRQPDGSTYRMWWQDLHQRGRMAFRSFVEAQPFGEFQALDRVLAALPPGSHLQLGNSMPIRYANYLGVAPGHEPANIAGNRGTSGIDGAVSTAVGAALVHNGLTVLIVGDLGFFYDRNGLWHDHAPPNLRILVLNNHGGGIFDIIEGPNRLPADVRQRYFLTPQPLSARRTAEDHGLRYLHANDAATLAAQLVLFLAPSDRPVLLEIESDMAINSAVFRRFREMMAGLQAR